jgi:peptide/nickel transport system ATP-binding protein
MDGAMPPVVATKPLVDVSDLHVRFVSREATVSAVNGVSFSLMPGEVLCIIGESGSGKSVTLRSMIALHPPRRTRITGKIRVGQHDILSLDERAMNKVRGSVISMVFQEPMTALDPVYRVGVQIAETVMHHEGCSRGTAMARALELLEMVKIPSPERRLSAFPSELSGGLRQRVMIAPTTALDATVQIQVLIMLRRLQRDLGMSMIFVTHDLGVAAQIADQVAVMYAGRIIERGSAAEVLRRPAHPYTLGLLSCTVHGQSRDAEIRTIPGSPPDMRALPPGCSFAPRCSFAVAACTAAFPPDVMVGEGHTAACIRIEDVRRSAAAAAA